MILHLFSYAYNLHALDYINYLSQDYEYIVIDLQKVFTSRYHTITQYTPLTPPNLYVKIITPKNLREFQAILDQYPDALIFKSFTDRWQDLYLHLILQSRKRTIIAYAHSSNIANVSSVTSKKNFASVFSFLFNNLLNRLYFAFFLLLFKFRLLPQIDTLFSSGKGEILTGARHSRINDFCLINDPSYDRYTVSPPVLSNNYIVFIGQNFPYATYDLKNHGEPPIKRDQYCKELCQTLRLLEKAYDKKIKICVHPKYDLTQKNNDFENFDIIQGNTEEYIQQAQLVVGHFSAGINYAVLLKKPILLLDSILFTDNPWIRSSIRTYEKLLHLKSHNMSTPFSDTELNTILNIDEQKYDFFIQNSISIYYPERIASAEIVKRYIRVKYFS